MLRIQRETENQGDGESEDWMIGESENRRNREAGEQEKDREFTEPEEKGEMRARLQQLEDMARESEQKNLKWRKNRNRAEAKEEEDDEEEEAEEEEHSLFNEFFLTLKQNKTNKTWD